MRNIDPILLGTDFSGIGSPEEALSELQQEGFLSFNSEFSCDIDKFARASYKAVHGPGKVYNDITERDHSEVRKLDLYVAGFPCQAFSIAGKQKGFDDVRGTLFFNVADFIRVNRPKTFILENVKGLVSHDKGRTFQTIIDLLSNCGGTVNGQTSMDFFDDGLGYHIHYKVLNTKDHGIPQNRERIFIVGFQDFRQYCFPVKQRLDLKLKDLLELDVHEKYYLSEKMCNGLIKGSDKFNGKFTPHDSDSKTAICITVTPGQRKTDNFIKVGYINQDTQASQVFSNEGCSPCLNSGTHGYAMGYVKIGAMRGRNEENPKSRKPGLPTKQHLEINENDTSNCLTSVQKDNLLVLYGTENNSQAMRVYDSEGLAVTQSSGGGGLGGKTGLYEVAARIRRLTPLECWRLQGFSDESFRRAQRVNSDTQLYKQAGNSMTKQVIKEVIRNIYK